MKSLTKKQLLANDDILDELTEQIYNAGITPEGLTDKELEMEWFSYLSALRSIKKLAARLRT